ncbi:MAG: DUF3108 domain-containing protein, partial [Candidatus Binatia bacterium]
MKHRFVVVSWLFLLSFSAHSGEYRIGGQGKTREIRPPAHLSNGGEKATYHASWNGIPIASAEIHATPQLIGHQKFYQVKIQARTRRYLDPIWKMRDSIESLFQADTFQPHRFVFRQRENRKKANTTALFDPGGKKWTVRRQDGKKVRELEFVSQRTFDPISATYLARSLNLKVGDKLEMEVFGGKSRYRVTLDVVAKEPVATKSGVFDAYKIIPRVTNLAREGYAERVREATVWISADETR